MLNPIMLLLVPWAITLPFLTFALLYQCTENQPQHRPSSERLIWLCTPPTALGLTLASSLLCNLSQQATIELALVTGTSALLLWLTSKNAPEPMPISQMAEQKLSCALQEKHWHPIPLTAWRALMHMLGHPHQHHPESPRARILQCLRKLDNTLGSRKSMQQLNETEIHTHLQQLQIPTPAAGTLRDTLVLNYLAEERSPQ